VKRRKRKPHKYTNAKEPSPGERVAEFRPGEKPWVKHMGELKRLHRETLRINRLIEQDSEKIDPGPGRPLLNVMWR
jgi:hypothetical protein